MGPSQCRPSALLAVALLLLVGAVQSGAQEVATPESTVVQPVHDLSLEAEEELSQNRNDTYLVSNGTVITAEELPAARVDPTEGLPAVLFAETPIPDEIDGPTTIQPVATGAAGVGAGNNATVYTATITEVPTTESVADVITVAPVEEVQISAQNDAQLDNFFATPGADAEMGYDGPAGNDTLAVLEEGLSAINQKAAMDADDGELEHTPVVVTEATEDNEAPVSGETGAINTDKPDDSAPVVADWTGAKDTDAVDEAGDIEGEAEDEEAVILPVMPDMTADEEYAVEEEGVPIKLGEDEELSVYVDFTEGPVVDDIEDEGEAGVAVGESPDGGDGTLSEETVGEDIVKNEEGGDANVAVAGVHTDEGAVEVVTEQGEDDKSTTERNATAGNGADDVMTPVAGGEVIEAVTGTAAPEIVVNGVIDDEGEAEEPIGGEEGEVEGAIVEGGQNIEEVGEGGNADEEGEDRVWANEGEEEGMERQMGAMVDGSNGEDTEEIVVEDEEVLVGGGDALEVEEGAEAPAPEGILEGEEVPELTEGALDVAEEAPVETEGAVDDGDVVNVGAIDGQAGLAVEVVEEMEESMGTEAPAEGVLADVVVGGTEEGVEAGVKGVTVSGGDVGEVVEGVAETEDNVVAVTTMPPTRPLMEERSNAVVRAGETADTPEWYPSFLAIEADRHRICRGRASPSCCADGESSCECAAAAKCVVAVGDPCDHHITASACEDSEDGSCAWSGLHGVCRDASNVCNTLDGEPLQCATTPGCVTEPVCAPACNTCSACFNMALRFADLSRHTTPVDLGPSFTRFCRRQSGHDVDCTAAGRLLDSEPGLLGRQLALCSAADACSGTCAASSAEVLESLGATDAIAAAGSALCLDAWGWDSAGVPNLPATAASRIALEPVNAAGVASDGPVNSGCVSAWDCDAGLQCSPSDCDVDIMCEAVTGRDATTTCPLQCAKPLPIGCDEANELNESICTSDVDCDDGLTCTAVNSCQIYACDDMGVMSVDSTCDKRCLEPATVLHAAFSGNDLRNVDILLSQPALPVIDAPCNAIFANVSLPQLGHAPRCSIRGEKLTVSLGVGASLSPEAGSAEIVPLTLSESQTAVRSALAVDGALFTGSVTSVSFPSPNGLPSPPIALLTGPVTVPEGGYCGDDNDLPAGLVLDASQSVAHSAGPLNTAWSLATFPEGVNTSVLLSRVADATGSKLLMFGAKELIAMLPGDYTFTVSVRDAVGRTSTATHALKVVPRGAVILPEVALPARLEFDPDTGLRVAADLDSTFACGVLDSIRFMWKDESLSTSNDPLLAFWGSSGLRLDSLELFIPPSLTSAVPTDDTRKFSFTVTAGNVTSRTTVEVTSVRKPPPVILSGPSGDVGVGMAVEFRAMALRAGELVPAAELASVAPVSYTCRHLPDGAPCVGANGRQPLQSGQDLVLPTGLVAANHSYEVCLEDPVEGVQNWLACKTIGALAEGSAPLGGIDPVCDGALALSRCLDAHPSAAPLRFHAWVVADDTALRWWSPQVELVAGENCNALNNSRLVIASDALPVGGRFEVKLNLTRGGVTAVSSVDVLIDEAPTCVFDECMSLSTEADRVVITAPGWADREGEPLRYEFGEVARNGAVMLPHAPPTHRPFFVLNTPLAAQSSEEVAHTFYVCAIDERNGRSCVISVLSVSGSRLSTQDTIAASVDKAFRTSHVSPVPLIAAARQVEAARVKLTAARVARALAVLADAAGVPAAGGAQLPVSFESLSNSARAASALLSINELPCGPVSQRVVDMASKYAEAVASDAATCVSVGSVADGLTLMGGAVATAARAECRQPVTGRRPTPSQVYTLDSVINRQAPRLAAAGRNCATEDDGPVIISSSTAGDGKSRLLSGMFRVNELTATGLKLPVDDAERASSPRRHHSRRILLEQDAPAHIDATVRVAFPGGFPLACAADPICEGVIPVSVLHSESVAALMEAISGGYWRSFSGAVLVETEGVVGGNVTVQIPLFVGSSYEAVACVALNRTTGQFVEIEMTGVTISSINCSVIPGSIVMMAASRVTPPASGDEGSEAAFEVPESPTQDEVQTSIQNLTRKWEAMPLWQKIVIPVSLVILLLLCCACGVGIFCMCCKRRSSKAANNIEPLSLPPPPTQGKKPKDVYQFSVSSAPAAAAQKTPKDRGQAISNPVFDAPGGGDAASTGRRRSAGLNSTFDSEGTLSPARTSVNTSPDRTQNAAGFGTGAGTRRPSTTSSPIRRVSGGHGSPGRASGSKSGPSHGGRRSFRAKGHTTWSSNNAENI